MNAVHHVITVASPEQTPFGRLSAICAHSGLSLEAVKPLIIDRMRLLAETTETLRDCERAAELAEQLFVYYEMFKPPCEHFTRLERSTVVIGSLFSDVGKTGPVLATPDAQRLVAEMFAIEHDVDGKTSVSAFFERFFPRDSADRSRRFRALNLDPDMTMRAFWNLHSTWTLQILRGDGVPAQAVAAAATHHLLENVNPHAQFVAEAPAFGRPEKLIVVLDKYEAARRRGGRTHEAAIVWLRELIQNDPRFHGDPEFLSLIAGLDSVVSHPLHSPSSAQRK